MERFYETVYEIFDVIHGLQNQSIDRNLHIEDASYVLGGQADPLARIGRREATYIGRDMATVLVPARQESEQWFEFERTRDFLRYIGHAIVGLNHCGVGYACQSIDQEMERYKQHVADSGFHMYEEASGLSSRRWLFLGDTDIADSCLFEIVLKQSRNRTGGNWFPHFQIDLDTRLQPVELKTIYTDYFGEDCIDFTIDIEDYGAVLFMVRLGMSDGINIYIGLGTALRDAAAHRKYDLHMII